MTNAQHTPGPWGDNNNGVILGNLDNYEHEAPIVCVVENTFDKVTEEGKANARLIAAAPDYDEAAKMAVDSASPVDASEQGFHESGIIISYGAYMRLKAAIAKATGDL